MKTINQSLPFTDKQNWAWPDYDKKLLQVFDQVLDIDYFLQFVERFDCVIQAGGACGVWPYRYAQIFKEVHTFEPSTSNWECLIKNLSGIDNVVARNAALSDGFDVGEIVFHNSEKDNCGAGYFSPGGEGVYSNAIDNFVLCPDLIQLDIEGCELEALSGARETIYRCSPVIVIEEKPLPQQKRSHLAAREWLESVGYKQVGGSHRDVVFKRL